ncbi:DMT family transporter [Krasilnikoviella flava]|uniref:Quaternary ammonium compound-resistance protein SugE n=1 Tax=Krasilnikoviella flava TaxID=526729 RepID=A0A1T5K6D2_9MICO|nr:multidrug efflux SMR transporter [Krasilnikoviella flava]SKC59183.1 quaternary ammonium compound-resistance protein SugE [Krasilnikoviella flava]
MSAKNANGAAWGVLLASSVLEAVWATALHASHGFTQPGPTTLFVVALALSMLGLGYAAKHLPIGTAYAIWTGIGAALTVAWAMLTGTETASLLKALFLLGIIGCAIGLKLVGDKADRREADDRAAATAD